MTTRTVHDDGTDWTLAEALVGSDAERQAANGTVPVVATPAGGAQSVRLALAPDWAQAMDDAALAKAVSAAR